MLDCNISYLIKLSNLTRCINLYIKIVEDPEKLSLLMREVNSPMVKGINLYTFTALCDVAIFPS